MEGGGRQRLDLDARHAVAQVREISWASLPERNTRRDTLHVQHPSQGLPDLLSQRRVNEKKFHCVLSAADTG